MFKSIDGGSTWLNEPMPTDPSFVFNNMNNFIYVGNNILYGIGGTRFFSGGGGTDRGVIWKTTNGGLNWGYQQPDTTIHIFNYSVIDFIDSLNGWAYNGAGNHGIHTTNGGGQIMFTAINIISTEIPNQFKLFQNYPNPFNPATNIKYQIINSKYITLKVYDILGREVSVLVDQKQNAGTYQVDFSGNGLASGIYFYSLIVGGVLIGVKKMVLLK